MNQDVPGAAITTNFEEEEGGGECMVSPRTSERDENAYHYLLPSPSSYQQADLMRPSQRSGGNVKSPYTYCPRHRTRRQLE